MLPVVYQIGISVLTAFGAFQYLNNNYLNYEGTFNDTWAMNKELSSNIHGQSLAIYQIIDFFSSKPEHSGINVLLLIGGPGVGKTYSMSIVKKYYYPENYYLEILPAIQPLNEDAITLTKSYVKWITRGFSLVIIDGINFHDQSLLDYLKYIDRYCHENNLATKIILIGQIIKMYATHDEEKLTVDKMKSYEQYTDFILRAGSDAITYFNINGLNNSRGASFVPLTPKDVKECVYSSIAELTIKRHLTSENIDRIVDNICKNRKDFSISGCKEVRSKILIK